MVVVGDCLDLSEINMLADDPDNSHVIMVIDYDPTTGHVTIEPSTTVMLGAARQLIDRLCV